MSIISLHNSTAPLTTAVILEQTAAKPLHLLPADALAAQWVSSESLWSDVVWRFDNDRTGCDRTTRITWSLPLPDGHNLLDPKHANMLDWARRLVWSSFAAPGDRAAAPVPATISVLGASLRRLLVWMTANDLARPADLTSHEISRYVDELAADDDITESMAYKRLMALQYLWRQRFELLRAGVAPLPQPPFGQRGVFAIAQKIARIATGQYRPLPDEVAIPVLNRSLWMLGTPADDVIRLAEASSGAYWSAHRAHFRANRNRAVGSVAQKEAAEAFQFSTLDGVEWHRPLNCANWPEAEIAPVKDALAANLDRTGTLPHCRIAGMSQLDLKAVCLAAGLPVETVSLIRMHPVLRETVSAYASTQHLEIFSTSVSGRVMQLVQAVVSAACIVIQSTTGMRISEICALQAGIDPETGLPRCVERRETMSGLGFTYIAKTKLTKTNATPKTEEWTIGYHLAGNTEEPPGVLGIRVVDRILAPYRALAQTDDLFVALSSVNSLPKQAAGVGRISPPHLARLTQDFIAEWVDLTGLPDEAANSTTDAELKPYRERHGRNIHTHQYRKLFANFVYRIDSSLLPVLQAHYHHVSIAMTESGYAASDKTLMQDLHDVRGQQSALAALRIARGADSLAGRRGEDLEELIRSDLSPKIAAKNNEEAYDEAFAWVEQNGLDKFSFEPYGICGARAASEMACHEAAGTVDLATWTNHLTPNYATREPNLCAGCKSFVIARWHLPFWEDRFVDNAASIALMEAQGEPVDETDPYVRVIRYRTGQARALCRKLGADLEALDARLRDRVREETHDQIA